MRPESRFPTKRWNELIFGLTAPIRSGTIRFLQEPALEKSKTYFVVTPKPASLSAVDEARTGEGRLAMPEVRLAREPSGSSQDISQPARERFSRQPRDSLCP